MLPMSPVSNACFIAIASVLSWCRPSSVFRSLRLMPLNCSLIIASDRRDWPEKHMTSAASSSFK